MTQTLKAVGSMQICFPLGQIHHNYDCIASVYRSSLRLPLTAETLPLISAMTSARYLHTTPASFISGRHGTRHLLCTGRSSLSVIWSTESLLAHVVPAPNVDAWRLISKLPLYFTTIQPWRDLQWEHEQCLSFITGDQGCPRTKR